MEFGLFLEFGVRNGRAPDDIFREGFELADLAERLGMHSVWLAEFHFMPDRSVLSSPIAVAAALAARTRRVRIGMAVYVLPLTHPLRVAEEVATVDQISGGRFDFGIGRSGFVAQYRGYDIDYGESEARFDEALEVLRGVFAGGRFSYEGRYYRVRDSQLMPPVHQKPHPPMYMAATSPATFAKVGALGLPLFVGLRGDGLEPLAANIRVYRETWAKAGHPGRPTVHLRVPVYAGATPEAAEAEARPTLVHYFERQARLVASQGAKKGVGRGGASATAARLAALTWKDIRAHYVAVGSSAELVETLGRWRETLDIDGVMVETNAGNGLTEQQAADSVQRIAEEVMPALG